MLTWGGYAPQEVVDQFEKETGIKVKVTKSNNEDMISKLRATRGAGFDLVQPSQDRIVSAQKEYRIYKPMDLGKLEQGRFISSMLEATSKSTRIGDKVYGVPHVWGTSGLIASNSNVQSNYSFNDLCSDDYKASLLSSEKAYPDRFCFRHGRGPLCRLQRRKKNTPKSSPG